MLNANRYNYLITYLSENYCTNMLEIGTNKGYTAEEMLKASLNKDIKYYGIDLFEDLTEEIIEKEFSIPTNSIIDVKNYLDSLKIGTINLLKGFSSEVLKTFYPSYKFDFIFIDGGHSYETVNIDIMRSLDLISDKGVIFIDDYSDEIPGIKQAIDELHCNMKKEILNEYKDNYRGFDYRMVKLSWN